MKDDWWITSVLGAIFVSLLTHLCVGFYQRYHSLRDSLVCRSSSSSSSSLRVHALRLTPGQELKSAILDYCAQHSLEAACILSCVGSLTGVHLRYAFPEGESYDRSVWSRGEKIERRFEILSMVGTIADKGRIC